MGYKKKDEIKKVQYIFNCEYIPTQRQIELDTVKLNRRKKRGKEH